MNTDLLKEKAILAVSKLQSAGFTAFWAGGCVRDIIMGKNPKDYDIATNALPETILTLFPGSISVGKVFGVIKAPIDEAFFEIATFRKDHAYEDGRRPAGVSFSDPETDSARRDFTINAIFYDPIAGAFHDYHGGQKDIKSQIIRCVGKPEDRFAEDHLRMLRAVRFASTLKFKFDPETYNAIKTHAALISKISAERIREELTRTLLESEKPGDALTLLDDTGLLHHIMPSIPIMKECQQPAEFHPEGNVFEHTVIMLNMMKNPSITLAYAILLHDAGKPPTLRIADDRIRFDGHAEKGAEMAEKILQDLRFPREEIERITYCIRNHMRFMDVKRMKQSTLRRLIGAQVFPIELELHRLDCLASHGNLDNYDFLLSVQKKFDSEPPLPAPLITGDDIIKMGKPQGPEIGYWLKIAYDAQLEGRFSNREDLLSWISSQINDTCK